MDEGLGDNVSAGDWWDIRQRLDRPQAEVLASELRKLWRAQYGEDTGDLHGDLRRLRGFFDPLSSGRRIRQALTKIRPVVPTSPYVRDPLAIRIDAQHHLITPEGRYVLGILDKELSREAATIALRTADLQEAQSVLLSLYRTWTQQRVRSVLALQEGRGAPLLPQAIGAILFLLVNDSTNSVRAVKRPQTKESFAELDTAIQRIIAAFADAFSPSEEARSRSVDQYSLYGGYALTEAKRRLGAQLVSEDRKLYIEEGAEKSALDRVGQELGRRAEVTPGRVLDAFDALVRTYHENRPILASYRSAYERPAHTRWLKESLANLLVTPPVRTESGEASSHSDVRNSGLDRPDSE